MLNDCVNARWSPMYQYLALTSLRDSHRLPTRHIRQPGNIGGFSSHFRISVSVLPFPHFSVFHLPIWYMPTLIYCKRGIVITTDSLLFHVEMSEHKSDSLLCGGELATWQSISSFPVNFPPHYHTILAISCVHASNCYIEHDKLMVKMTILFLLYIIMYVYIYI